MKKYLSILAMAAAGSALAFPQISNVTITRDAAKRTFTVSYDLSESGIVTAVFYKGSDDTYEKIHESKYAEMAGDIGKYVEVPDGGATRSFLWQTEYGMPDTVFSDNVSVELTAWEKSNPPDYVAIDISLVTNTQKYAWVKYYTSTNGLPGGIDDIRWREHQLLMRKIPAAGITWWMGSPDGENGRNENEVRHKVRLSDDYYMAVFPTTYGQSRFMYPGTYYAAYRSDNSLDQDGDVRYAQGGVAYYHLLHPDKCGTENYGDAVSYLIIGKMQQLSGIKFYLPTEAQWEFACRSGCGAPFYNGATYTSLAQANVRELGWIYYRTGGPAEDGNPYGPRPVGLKKPNAWGLYDLVGNVAEACYDAYGAYATSDSYVVDPVGAESVDPSKNHVIRGGYYNKGANDCRSARHNYAGTAGAYLGYGFRLVCPVDLYGRFTGWPTAE